MAKRIQALGHKIDLIVTQNNPTTIEQLDRLFGMLREMAAHAASDETVSALSARVQALADKIDYLAIGGSAGDAFNRLELRIDALSRAVSDRVHAGDAAIPRLEALIQSCPPRSSTSNRAETGLHSIISKRRIAKFIERLETTGSRLNHLDAIERGLADLLVYVEAIRLYKETNVSGTNGAENLDFLKQDMARTHEALEAVHGTLGRVADRLTTIEKNIEQRAGDFGDRRE